MLDIYERQPDRRLGILIELDYEIMKADQIETFEKAAKGMASAGIVDVRMRRPPDDHLIKNVTLKDPVGLYSWIGRQPRSNVAVSIWNGIVASIPEAPEWLAAESRKAVNAWAEHRPWRGIEMKDARDAEIAVRLAIALEDGASPGTSHRAFSAAHANDSKALKRVESIVSTILREAMDLPPLQPGEEPLAIFGISTFPDPVLLRGPFRVGTGGGIDLAEFQLYAAVTAPSVGTLEWHSEAPYVLTIENKASFNAYIRNISDEGVVVFTGGWPSSATLQALKIIAQGKPDTPWFHWGDIDGGGLAIFRHLETEVCQPAGISLRPHLMTPNLATKFGQRPQKRMQILRKLSQSDSAVAELAAWLLSPEARILEQEIVAPTCPVLLADQITAVS